MAVGGVDGIDRVAHADVRSVGKLHGRQPLGVDLQNGEIRRGITSDEVCVIVLPVRQRDAERPGILKNFAGDQQIAVLGEH